jgi:lipopolysaccharide heptosyltransferase I
MISGRRTALKVLILKPSSLGDVVQALPVLRLIKRHLPQSEIHWWIDSGLAPLLEGDPDLAGVLRFERRRWATPRNWVGFCRSVFWTRSQRFDWVLDLQGLFRSGAFAWLANGELTIGLDESRERAYGFYDLRVPRASFHTHAVDWYLAVLKTLHVPIDSRFEWLPKRPAIAESVRRVAQARGNRWIALQPGARWANKRWPVEYYAEVGRRLVAEHKGASIVLLGGREDQPLGAAIASAVPERCLDLTGRISLPEMVEWLRICQLMVTNDTGPMHVAAALGTPVVALFGPTEPRRTGPYGQLPNVLQLGLPWLPCVPCMKPRCRYSKPMECLRALQPEPVLLRSRALLAEDPRV